MSDPREQAQALHRSGDLAAAKAAYASLLSADAEWADGWHRLAIIHHQGGALKEARMAAERSVALSPAAAYVYLAGFIAFDQGDLDGAVAHFSRAVALRPEWLAGHRSLGEALYARGNLAGAQDAFRQALVIKPDDPSLWSCLAAAQLDQGELVEAEASVARALRLNSNAASALYQSARLAERRGGTEATARALEACLAADPTHEDALALRAAFLRRHRDPDTMLAYDLAVQARPRQGALQTARAEFLWEQGRLAEAAEGFRAAERLDPSSFRAAVGSRLMLPPIYDTASELQEARQAYAKGLEELSATRARFEAPRADALSDLSWTNFFLAYQGCNDRALQSQYGDLLSASAAARVPRLSEAPERAAPPGRRPRIGFASHFFFNCTAGRYFSSWILDLDPARFETVVFYSNAWVSPDTEAIRAAATRFHHVAGRPLAAVAEAIRAERLDVLVYPELGMHADTFVLAALRLAPIQLAGWGHPTTTGLPTIDGYLSCAEMEPPEAMSAHYRERLFLLPGLGTRYRKPETDSRRSRADFGLPEQETLYLCPQSLFKIHPDNDALFAEVLSRDPRGRLIFFDGRSAGQGERFRSRLEAALVRCGLDVARLTFLPYMAHGDFLRAMALCDVMLDTRHWSGGNTALDAIAMGLPIVTLPGEMMRGRQSTAMLNRLGLQRLIARDEGHFVDIAIALGADRGERASIGQVMSREANALFDDHAPTAELARILLRLASEDA